jgi:hypothetical protein
MIESPRTRRSPIRPLIDEIVSEAEVKARHEAMLEVVRARFRSVPTE